MVYKQKMFLLCRTSEAAWHDLPPTGGCQPKLSQRKAIIPELLFVALE